MNITQLQQDFETFALKHNITHAKVNTANLGVTLSVGEPYTKLRLVTNNYGHKRKHPIPPEDAETPEALTSFIETTNAEDKAYWVKKHKTLRANRSPEQVARDKERQKVYQRGYQRAKRQGERDIREAQLGREMGDLRG